jgi:hypothetical protein
MVNQGAVHASIRQIANNVEAGAAWSPTRYTMPVPAGVVGGEHFTAMITTPLVDSQGGRTTGGQFGQHPAMCQRNSTVTAFQVRLAILIGNEQQMWSAANPDST